jgi:hypothetical protein
MRMRPPRVAVVPPQPWLRVEQMVLDKFGFATIPGS